jgi:hypothetical protein
MVRYVTPERMNTKAVGGVTRKGPVCVIGFVIDDNGGKNLPVNICLF